jgi:hypothetical protein
MRPITLALTLTLAGCSSSCGTNKPAVNWPRIVSCTEPAQLDMLAAVQRILSAPDPEAGVTSSIGDRAVTELERMAVAHGEHVVACLVDEAVRSFEDASKTAAAAPKVSPDVPPEPARKSLRAAPAPRGPAEPVQTVPDSDGTTELYAAARGRDFLERVAKTHVREPIAQ